MPESPLAYRQRRHHVRYLFGETEPLTAGARVSKHDDIFGQIVGTVAYVGERFIHVEFDEPMIGRIGCEVRELSRCDIALWRAPLSTDARTARTLPSH